MSVEPDPAAVALEKLRLAVADLAESIAAAATAEAWVMRRFASERRVADAYIRASEKGGRDLAIAERREIALRWLVDPHYQPPGNAWMVILD